MCAAYQGGNVVVPDSYVARYEAAGYTIGACTGPSTTVMCRVVGTFSASYVVPLSSVSLYQSQYGMTLGACILASTTAMCAPNQAGTVLAPNQQVPRYQAAGYTIGECTGHPTTPMCTAPPYPPQTVIVPNGGIAVRQNLGWTVGECGGR